MAAVIAAITLLSLPQVAEMLGKSEGQLRWMIHTGTAPKSALIGGRRMFRLEGVDGVLAWIDKQFDADAEKRSA